MALNTKPTLKSNVSDSTDDKSHRNKIIVISSITAVALIALVTLLVFQSQFVGKVIEAPTYPDGGPIILLGDGLVAQPFMIPGDGNSEIKSLMLDYQIPSGFDLQMYVALHQDDFSFTNPSVFAKLKECYAGTNGDSNKLADCYYTFSKPDYQKEFFPSTRSLELSKIIISFDASQEKQLVAFSSPVKVKNGQWYWVVLKSADSNHDHEIKFKTDNEDDTKKRVRIGQEKSFASESESSFGRYNYDWERVNNLKLEYKLEYALIYEQIKILEESECDHTITGSQGINSLCKAKYGNAKLFCSDKDECVECNSDAGCAVSGLGDTCTNNVCEAPTCTPGDFYECFQNKYFKKCNAEGTGPSGTLQQCPFSATTQQLCSATLKKCVECLVDGDCSAGTCNVATGNCGVLPATSLGDVDCNTFVNDADALKVKLFANSKITEFKKSGTQDVCSANGIPIADVDCNVVVNDADALKIKLFANGKLIEFKKSGTQDACTIS
jgi:hypothetical protein